MTGEFPFLLAANNRLSKNHRTVLTPSPTLPSRNLSRKNRRDYDALPDPP